MSVPVNQATIIPSNIRGKKLKPSDVIKKWCSPCGDWPYILNLDNLYTENVLTAADEHKMHCIATGEGAEMKGLLQVMRGFDPNNGAWFAVVCLGCGWWMLSTEANHLYPPEESFSTAETVPPERRGGVIWRATIDRKKEEHHTDEADPEGAAAEEDN